MERNSYIRRLKTNIYESLEKYDRNTTDIVSEIDNVLVFSYSSTKIS